ncbi:uncharacterized protein LOC129313467 isoform X2 [Prosopis cineraria]|uniref:uncharacterized protein LOC129313467 isoform X2 n=1 Tax=Prosopis cineraria TaxID=364024 RepID=UPI00240F4773|nr:uncharacterized protein LOC129313467 isoform X2 [Prosopis cineraria]
MFPAKNKLGQQRFHGLARTEVVSQIKCHQAFEVLYRLGASHPKEGFYKNLKYSLYLTQMINMDDPLDFEREDQLLKVPSTNNKKRKKVIGLDDLLNDHYIEQNKLKEKQSKKAKARKNSHEDDDEYNNEAMLSKIVEKCEKQMNELGGEEEIFRWGVPAFGDQKAFPPLDFSELESCNIVQSFVNNNLNSVVELTTEKGDKFLEGLLINGWLPKLVFLCQHVEKSIAIWAFNKMLYSTKEEMQTCTCDFWCAILSSTKEDGQLTVKIDWFPSYKDLRTALDIYGFLFNFSSSAETVDTGNSQICFSNIQVHDFGRWTTFMSPTSLDSSPGGPPQNIRAWVRFVTACCLIRSQKAMFSAVEAEEIIEVIICLFLDRQLQGLLIILNDCMQAIVNYFTDQEWSSSCENIAKFIACRVSKDLNCIQAVECISEVSSRCKQLRSAVAYESLLPCFDGVSSGDEILRSLVAINLKDKSVDLFKMYIYLALAENWILSNPVFEDNPVLYEMFCHYLKNCSSLISSTDLRSHASKIRNKAAYLLHFFINK